LQFDVDKTKIEESQMHISGHKIFVRMKDVPMYLSKKTKDSIRNRYSHSIEVGLSTKYILNSLNRELGNGVDLDFFGVANIVGMVHDIGHTAFSHDGEVILDNMLKEASSNLPKEIRFNANINNFRRIDKYGLFDLLPDNVKKYAMASLIKRKRELGQYPEYLYLKDYLRDSIAFEQEYLLAKGVKIDNQTGKTILCQAMDMADENRYRVTDIIDAFNIYSKEKLSEILKRGINSSVRVKDIRKITTLPIPKRLINSNKHIDKIAIKDLLVMLLEQESSAKTEFQNSMNHISMAFNRNFSLSDNGRLIPKNSDIEQLRDDFAKIAAKYIWGSKKVNNIKKPYRHYFATVADYFINHHYNTSFVDSVTYKKALDELRDSTLSYDKKRYKELILMRNFLGGLTNPKIIELYKKIRIEEEEAKLSIEIAKKDKLIYKVSIGDFEKKLRKNIERLGIAKN